MLTEKENKELSNFNAAAFDLYRVESGNQKVPFWLCMSDEGKEECRERLYQFAKERMGIANLSLAAFEAQTNSMLMPAAVHTWRMIEEEAKCKREKVNLGAYFI
jgi:hypothetical protein